MVLKCPFDAWGCRMLVCKGDFSFENEADKQQDEEQQYLQSYVPAAGRARCRRRKHCVRHIKGTRSHYF